MSESAKTANNETHSLRHHIFVEVIAKIFSEAIVKLFCALFLVLGIGIEIGEKSGKHNAAVESGNNNIKLPAGAEKLQHELELAEAQRVNVAKDKAVQDALALNNQEWEAKTAGRHQDYDNRLKVLEAKNDQCSQAAGRFVLQAGRKSVEGYYPAMTAEAEHRRNESIRAQQAQMAKYYLVEYQTNSQGCQGTAEVHQPILVGKGRVPVYLYGE